MSGTEMVGAPMAELAVVRAAVLDEEHLVRAVASGRRRGQDAPPWRRVELRHVDLKSGRHLQVARHDETSVHTTNHPMGEPARVVVDELLALPFGNWHVDTTAQVHQLRITRKGRALLHTSEREAATQVPRRRHDHPKERLLPAEHPVFHELGIADARGKVKPSRQAKYRQVEDFLRSLQAALDDAQRRGRLRAVTAEEPLRMVDLGCGNAYLTFAAHFWLRDRLPVRTLGIDVKEQSRRDNTGIAERLGVDGEISFLTSGIAEAQVEQRPDVVLALHACDTATDEALHRGIDWQAGLILAAPCCHHDVSAQLRRVQPPPGYATLLREGILRERLADTLTDALRASLLRQHGYRVDVTEFVPSKHTPRNTLLRAVRTGRPADDRVVEEYAELVGTWQLRPRLAELLEAPG